MDNGQNPLKSLLDLQKSMMQQIPMAGGVDRNEVEQFVRKTIKSFMQSSIPQQALRHPIWAADDIDYELFESQRAIFVRCKFPEKTDLYSVRMYASNKKLRVEHGEKTREIKLPGDVNPLRAIARIDGDIIEIRLPRTRESETLREIYFRD